MFDSATRQYVYSTYLKENLAKSGLILYGLNSLRINRQSQNRTVPFLAQIFAEIHFAKSLIFPGGRKFREMGLRVESNLIASAEDLRAAAPGLREPARSPRDFSSETVFLRLD